MEECPGPVLPFCRQPESEQEQLACGSSRGEQQFGSVWFHGWKHLQVRNPLFPCLLCETLHCVICDTHACSQSRLGTPLPSVRPCLCYPLFSGPDPVFCETLPFCETLCETLHSVRPCLLLGPSFCESEASVQHVTPCVLWNQALCESLLWVTRLAFCETLPSVRPWLLWSFAFCEGLPSVLPSVRPCLWLMGDTLSSVKPCLSVRPCLPWCVRPCHLF